MSDNADQRITSEMFHELSPAIQNAVITAVMDYIQTNDLPYDDTRLYESALQLITEDEFPIALKIEFVNSI